MKNFLTFNTFIAQDILVFFYYIFAILVPIFLWIFNLYIVKKISFVKILEKQTKYAYQSLNINRKVQIMILFIAIFFFLELCLRIFFEAMIGYFDIHQYLFEITQKLNDTK